MDLSVTLKGQTHDLTLKNPVLTASGTFGYGMEFATYGNLAALGGMVVKGLSLLPRQGNATPRIVETTAGMLNAVGLQNDGVENFCKTKLPRLPGRKQRLLRISTQDPWMNLPSLQPALTKKKAWPRLRSMFRAPTSRRAACFLGRIPPLPLR